MKKISPNRNTDKQRDKLMQDEWVQWPHRSKFADLVARGLLVPVGGFGYTISRPSAKKWDEFLTPVRKGD